MWSRYFAAAAADVANGPPASARLDYTCARAAASRGHVDPEQLDRFVADEYPRVVAAVTLVCGDASVAEDAVQEALARAVERRQDITNLAAWVTTVAGNHTRSRFRRLGRERRAVQRLTAGAEEHHAARDGVARAADVIDVHRAVTSLPRRQREAIVLRYFLGLDVAEVAAHMRIAPGTVKALLHQGRRAMAAALAPRPGEGTAGDGRRAGGDLLRSAVVEVRP
jgi:RNA polymerase sigma-70 factor (ECF subfamily)